MVHWCQAPWKCVHSRGAVPRGPSPAWPRTLSDSKGWNQKGKSLNKVLCRSMFQATWLFMRSWLWLNDLNIVILSIGETPLTGGWYCFLCLIVVRVNLLGSVFCRFPSAQCWHVIFWAISYSDWLQLKQERAYILHIALCVENKSQGESKVVTLIHRSIHRNQLFIRSLFFCIVREV